MDFIHFPIDIMDAIGVLAAFASDDLQKLQYTSINGVVTIPRSKFIIVFSGASIAQNAQIGISGNFVHLITPGNNCYFISQTGVGSYKVLFDESGTIVTVQVLISIAYCPI